MNKQFSHVKLLFLRLGIAMLAFSICRFLFFSINNYLFPQVEYTSYLSVFFWGFRFDLSALIYVNALVILGHILPFSFRNNSTYQRWLKWMFLGCNGFAVLVELCDIEYFRLTLRRSTINVADQLGDVMDLLPQYFRDFGYLLVLTGVIVWLMNYLFNKTLKRQIYFSQNHLWQSFLFVLLVVLSGIAARGGLQLIPLMPITAANYVNNVALAPLVSNTSLNIIHSFQQRSIQELHYFSEADLKQHFTLLKTVKQDSLSMKKENVVVIMMESFGKNIMGKFNDFEGATPFLDSLMEEGLYFSNSYANGRQSNQGVVSVTAGIPALMEDPLMISAFQSNRVKGLAGLLKEEGYSTHFFHGGNNGTFNFDRFSKTSGFENYYGRDEYGIEKDFDGNWGVYDLPFFRYTLEKLNGQQMPFMSLLFSLTSHHPFPVPDWFAKKHPDLPEVDRCFLYSDYALRVFFEEAAKQDWFEHTLFVITADHVGYIHRDEYKTREGMYRIPILFYKSDGSLKGKKNDIAQQVDILPSVLDYLNYSKSYKAFGQSFFKEEEKRYAYMFVNGIYQILDKEFILLFNGTKSIGLFNYQKDRLLKENLLELNLEKKSELELKIKAVLQVHHQAMLKNELVQ